MGLIGGRTFWSITFPLLRNSLIFVSVTLMIGAWQVFTQMYVMTRGGPAGKTESVQWTIWANAFQDFDMGVAAAMSWALFAVVFVFTAIQLRIFHVQTALLGSGHGDSRKEPHDSK